MTCQDCGFELNEDYGSDLLAREMAQIKETGRCLACAWRDYLDKRIRELKGEDSGRTDIRADTATA